MMIVFRFQGSSILRIQALDGDTGVNDQIVYSIVDGERFLHSRSFECQAGDSALFTRMIFHVDHLLKSTTTNLNLP